MNGGGMAHLAIVDNIAIKIRKRHAEYERIL
jgi:hypothetical protein